ncbi:hypothetical protein [Nocardioides sp.]|uniref:hypothetical protein n=1 Tax=Nocardioides sp. TaxID=35761 RepID=UPI002625F202|nr:hypothetical protein [Nocardioides sp.]
MAKRRFVVHLGLPDTGAGGLAAALAAHAGPLAEAGVRVPARSADEARRAALELRRLHSTYGLKRKEVEGTLALLCKRARKEGAKTHDAVVVSDDLLAGATREQVALLLDSLAGFEVHLVATLADPARQLVAAWSEAVRAGSDLELRRYARRVLDPARRLDEAGAFWADQDVEQVLERWSSELRRPDRVHVVVPQPGEDPVRATWQCVARVVGADPASLPLETHAGAATPAPAGLSGPAGAAAAGSLGSSLGSLEVLRGVNASVDGRADGRIRRQLVDAHLAPTSDALPPAPADLHEELLDLGERWRKALADGGYDVVGDTTPLLPSPAPVRAVVEPTTEERLATTTDALGDLLVELARTREHVEDLLKRNAKLERKRASLRTRLAAALVEG